MITKVISGGQTGADRAGLRAARDYGIPFGGWCPKGFRAEDGIIPEPWRSALKETDTTSGYELRTELNVSDSDGTLIFTVGRITPGSRLTVKLCEQHGKPCKHIDLSACWSISETVAWLRDRAVHVLNVAGSRRSKAPSIEQRAYEYLQFVLESLGYRQRRTNVAQQ